MELIQMINSSVFLNRNSFTSIEEMAEKDAEGMAKIVNMVRYTMTQGGPSQAVHISFSLYSNNEEKLNEKKIEDLGEKIEFGNRVEVTAFLLKNDFLIHIINEAVEKIREIFKTEKLKLVVETDPEMPIDSKVLSLKIFTELDPIRAINSLDKLNKEWWLEIKPMTKQKLIIEEEYV